MKKFLLSIGASSAPVVTGLRVNDAITRGINVWGGSGGLIRDVDIHNISLASQAIIVHASVTGVVNYEMFSFINQEDPQRFALLGAELITTAVYLLIGLICLSLGRRTLDWITKFDLNKEIQLERNVGVGAIEASMYISIAIIIHGIMV